MKKEFNEKICIVGSGVGPTIISYILLKKGFKISLVEAGNDVFAKDKKVNFENIGREFLIPETNSIEVGGTTNLWLGGLTPFQKNDFQKDIQEKNNWPLDFDEFNKYTNEALSLLFSFSNSKNLINLENIEEEELNISRNSILSDRNILDFNNIYIPNPIIKCKRVLKFLENKYKNNFKIYRDHVALELIIKNRKVSQLKVGCKDNIIAFKANNFILCAGALETPRLLLNSNIKNKNIGRYLMDHPKGYLSEIKLTNKVKKSSIYGVYFHRRSDLQIKNLFTIKDNVKQKSKLLNHGFFLKPLNFSLYKTLILEKLSFLYNSIHSRKLQRKDFLFLIKNFLYLPLAAYSKYNKRSKSSRLGVYVISEQSPNYNSKVSLSRIKDRWGYPIAQVNWVLKKSDIKNIHKAYEVFKKAFQEENTIFKNERVYDHNFMINSLESAAHHSGTARMSSSQIHGVIDKNCKVFGIDNLFICDTSIFTRSGNANPVLNISIFSLRLSYYLMQILIK